MLIDVYRRFPIVVELDKLLTLSTLIAFNTDSSDLFTNVNVIGAQNRETLPSNGRLVQRVCSLCLFAYRRFKK
jgi:hypothetical protein